MRAINYQIITDFKIGINWLKSGWVVFKYNPLTWIATLLTIIVCLGLLNNFFIGKFIAMIVAPYFAGGVYLNLHQSNQGNNISFLGLFSALNSDYNKQLLLLGVMGTVVVLLDYAFHHFSFFTQQMQHIDSRTQRSLDSSFSLGGALSWLIHTMWGIALSFCVPLVVLRHAKTLPALKLSIVAVLHNIPALLVYYIMVMILLFISIIPVGLGLFISLPVIFCASYFVFSAIFTDENNQTTTEKTLEDYKK